MEKGQRLKWLLLFHYSKSMVDKFLLEKESQAGKFSVWNVQYVNKHALQSGVTSISTAQQHCFLCTTLQYNGLMIWMKLGLARNGVGLCVHVGSGLVKPLWRMSGQHRKSRLPFRTWGQMMVEDALMGQHDYHNAQEVRSFRVTSFHYMVILLVPVWF